MEVGAAATEMVFLFQRTVVHCSTESVLAPVATIVAMLGHTSVFQFIGAEVGAGTPILVNSVAWHVGSMVGISKICP